MRLAALLMAAFLLIMALVVGLEMFTRGWTP